MKPASEALLLDKLLRLLAFRPRSQKEIKDYLWRKKVDNSLAEKLIKQLGEMNLLNDGEFTSWWVDQRSTFRPRGKIALGFELRAKGIDPEMISEALAGLDELSLAQKAIFKKKNLTPERKIGFLVRRGFSFRVAKEAVANNSRIS